MDEDDFEGTAGSDFEDLMNIECDVDDDNDGMGIDVSLLISDDDDDDDNIISFENVENLQENSDDKKPTGGNIKSSENENKPDAKDVDNEDIKKPDTKDEEVKSKVEESKKPEIKVLEPKKLEAKVEEKKKPEAMVEEKKKPEAKVEEKKKSEAKVEEKKKPEAKVEEKKKAETKVEVATKPETKVESKKKPESAATDKKKPEVKAEEQKKQGTKVEEKKKPETKTGELAKPGVKNTEKKKTETKIADKKAVENKNDLKKSGNTHDTKKKEPLAKEGLTKDVKPVVISDDENMDDDSDAISLATIEGDVDDLPEEWMVIDEMDDDAEKKKEVSKKENDRSKRDQSSRRNDSGRRRSRHRSRSRSRSRSRTNFRDEKDSRRASDREKSREGSKTTSQKKTPEKEKGKDKDKKTVESKSKTTAKKTDEKSKKVDEAKTESKKTKEAVKPTAPPKAIDPFKNMRDTIEKFDKNWRWNLKISPIEISDLKSDVLRDIIGLANDSVMVFNMQNDKKSKYGFLDLCLSSASDIRQAIDKLCLLKMESNFIHVSISHKLFDDKAGVESALLKLDMREGKHITSQPVKGTEKQRKINISNGPKGMSKLMLDAVFSKIAQIEITENAQTDTSSATVLCSNPESVGAMLRFYQSVVIGGRRLQIHSEVAPPPPPKETPKEQKRSPSASSNASKASNSNPNSRDKNSRDSANRRRTNSANRQRKGENMSSDGLLGPIPSSVFSTAMGSGRGFENMDVQERHRVILAREEAERRQESMKRLGITVGVENFLEGPGPLRGVQELIQQETERLSIELKHKEREMQSSYRSEMYRQEDMRMQREMEMNQQAELRERQERQHQEDMMLRRQQEQQERMEREKMERLEFERKERERLERERLDREQMERDQMERERMERLERERLERQELERRERERLEQERLEKERKEKEMKERQERERLEREMKEIERQEELKRHSREAKMRQEQQQRDRFGNLNRRPQHNQWQHNAHLQNEQDQFEKEIGITGRNDYGRGEYNYEPPAEEEKKNLHQKIREQWERQVAEASTVRGGNQGRSNVQQERPAMHRKDNNGNSTPGSWGREGGNWDDRNTSGQSGYGNWAGPKSAAGLLGEAPGQPKTSPYGSAVRDYGVQPTKRPNPWGEEAPNYGEKRGREEEEQYAAYSRDGGGYSRPEQNQYGEQNQREPERVYGQAAWGAGADPHRNKRPGQQYQPNW